MLRVQHSWVLLLPVATLKSSCGAGQASAAPDIIVLLADDLGATGIGPEGCKPVLLAPHIDSLGKARIAVAAGYA